MAVWTEDKCTWCGRVHQCVCHCVNLYQYEFVRASVPVSGSCVSTVVDLLSMCVCVCVCVRLTSGSPSSVTVAVFVCMTQNVCICVCVCYTHIGLAEQRVG
ncbi:unnamed protein product [Chrysodeixis includens]|uniref:Uncharacterized protein n=1 Tax=Chrysodeixis includens TaxID=689277 RepID=A0A9N8Q317_CHRIL|nr:unnamed protein product [Chrysodeixis includens]